MNKSRNERGWTSGPDAHELYVEMMESQQPKVTEFVYKWPDGHEEVRYRRPYNSKESLELINELLELAKKHGEACPYSFRHV